MDFKIKITCRCGCIFELRSDSYKPCASLACPNCTNTVPDDILADIKTGIATLAKIPSSYPAEDAFSVSDFSFEVLESPHPFGGE